MRGTVLLLLLLLACSGVSAQESEVDQLKAEVKGLRERLDSVQARLEAMGNNSCRPVPEPSHVTAKAGPPPPQTQPRREGDDEIRHRDVLSYDAAGAPRVDNIPVESSDGGYFDLPGNTRVKLGGYARLDLIRDFKPAGYPTAFIPSTIPTGPTLGVNSTVVDINQSRLNIDIRRPTSLGELRIFYENDFFGGSTQEPAYNLRHLYGQLHNVLVGYTFSGFLDVDTDPDTLDYEGPNGNTWAAAAQVRYTQPFKHGQSLAISAESPVIDVQANNSQAVAVSRIPDFALKYRFEGERGHMQLSSVFRDIGGYVGTQAQAHVFGWGLTFAGAHSVGERDAVMADISYGHGIGHYLVDLFGQGADAGFNADGKLLAIPGFGSYAAYQHYWSKQWRSTATYGYTRVSNVYSQPPDAFHSSHYAAGNVIWNIRNAVSVGTELLYGNHIEKNKSDGNATRLQIGIQYDLFPPHD